MGQRWNLSIEPPKPLQSALEHSLLQQAVNRSPDSVPLVMQLATRLLIDDRFDELISLLEARQDLPPRRVMYLVQAYFSRETEAANLTALALIQQELPRTQDRIMRARLLADMGKACMRLGRPDDALDALAAALRHNPQDRNAFKRIVAVHLQNDEPDRAIALAERLLRQGISHSRLLASLVLAHAKAGNTEAAQQVDGRNQFMLTKMLSPPAGWSSMDSFNQALASQLCNHSALRFDRYGAASTRTWRIDTPAMPEAPLVTVLQDLIAAELAGYVAQLSDQNQHPWLSARPSTAVLHNWCVLTDANGQEEWHVHQNGWLSGTYYVSVPATVQDGGDDAGCLIFGLPEDAAGHQAAAAFGRERLRPVPGMLTAFPSHCYHRTYPHGADTRRICLAFDIWPR